MELSISAPVAQENPNQFPTKRGLYRKRDQRAAALALPQAWQIGNRKSFAAARARAVRGIALDLGLSSREKAALVKCLDHMNAGERWSCFASIPTIAKEVGVDKSTVWRAICRADGKHILTKRGRRTTGSKYPATNITIHPNYVAELRPSFAGQDKPLTKEKWAAELAIARRRGYEWGGPLDTEGMPIPTNSAKWVEIKTASQNCNG